MAEHDAREERKPDPGASPEGDFLTDTDDRGADMGAGYEETSPDDEEVPGRGPGVEDAFRGGT